MTPETCPKLDTLTEDRQALFQNLDSQMRSIDKRWSEIWMEAADVAMTVQDSQLWREGGYHSFEDWLKKAAVRSRSWVYLALAARKELRDISDEDLRQIPLGNADILKMLPKAIRGSQELLEAARSTPPRTFISRAIAASAGSYLEKLVKRSFTSGQWEEIEARIELFRKATNEPTLGYAEALLGIVISWEQSMEQLARLRQ